MKHKFWIFTIKTTVRWNLLDGSVSNSAIDKEISVGTFLFHYHSFSILAAVLRPNMVRGVDWSQEAGKL